MKTPQPSPAELLHHHLEYEFAMLNDTFARIGRYDADPIVANALIESFCIHARVLFEFFEKSRGAATYADASYRLFDGGDPKRREAITRKLNNQVAHVLDCRTAEPADKIGPTERAEMRALLSAEFAKFKAHLLPAYAVVPAVVTTGTAPSSATNDIVIVTSTNTVAPSKP